MAGSYWIETLGCPKNQVDSDKLSGVLEADGLSAADGPADADLVVINTCAFIDAARQESIDTILALTDVRRPGARIVVTGCLAERSGPELADALPEVDLVAGFGERTDEWSAPVALVPKPAPLRMDLLNLPRPAARAPWAYVKVAEGCDRACGFCAIPSFRGRQRSRTLESILAEVDSLGVAEIVLVAQDLASYGRDIGQAGAIHELVAEAAQLVPRVRLLYLYPSELNQRLVDTVCSTGLPYFDLSLQHVSRPLLRRMRRWGDGRRFLDRISAIRARQPDAAFRSSFIVGYPGETEEDHDQLLTFLEEAQLDWAGFFPYSREEGTYSDRLDGHVEPALVAERISELTDLQDRITTTRRAALIATETEVLVDAPGTGRSHREAPEIDGVIELPDDLPVGSMVPVRIVDANGPDLEAVPVGEARPVAPRWDSGPVEATAWA
ncbi:MAG TPA: 30S ribosomal protein S12 methylthiotransferase RimO [Acidimicrobiales bacterium]|nr:30S ribosomal protein S12 methylthiotransferase RimO [Acidimicrobiales bacterium]